MPCHMFLMQIKVRVINLSRFNTYSRRVERAVICTVHENGWLGIWICVVSEKHKCMYLWMYELEINCIESVISFQFRTEKLHVLYMKIEQVDDDDCSRCSRYYISTSTCTA